MSSLGNKLRELSNSTDSFFLPDDSPSVSPKDKSYELDDDDFDLITEQKGPKGKKKKKTFEKMESYLDGLGLSDSDLSDTFDGFIEGLGEEEDSGDSELYNSILSMGRRYARDTQTAEVSEIQKAFSGNEKEINKLLGEIHADKERISKYLHSMSPRMASPKNIAELQETLNTLHNNELAAIKEKNAMKKNIIELNFKAKAQKKDEEGDNNVNGNLIRDVLGMGRRDIMESVGGYSGVSGAMSGDDDEESDSSDDTKSDAVEYNDTADDDAVHAKYFHNEEEETESDKYLKYQDVGAHYVLMIDGEENKTVIAEDRDGNVLDDYPLPDISECSFEVDEKDNSATDDFFRRYEIRRV